MLLMIVLNTKSMKTVTRKTNLNCSTLVLCSSRELLSLVSHHYQLVPVTLTSLSVPSCHQTVYKLLTEYTSLQPISCIQIHTTAYKWHSMLGQQKCFPIFLLPSKNKRLVFTKQKLFPELSVKLNIHSNDFKKYEASWNLSIQTLGSYHHNVKGKNNSMMTTNEKTTNIIITLHSQSPRPPFLSSSSDMFTFKITKQYLVMDYPKGKEYNLPTQHFKNHLFLDLKQYLMTKIWNKYNWWNISYKAEMHSPGQKTQQGEDCCKNLRPKLFIHWKKMMETKDDSPTRIWRWSYPLHYYFNHTCQ